MNEFPAPLTPADCDLRDMDGFMLNAERLLASELWALSTGDEFKAAMGLWCRAWKQVPAASLPDDERILASFAGVSLARWRKISGIAMRGFIACSDGRLYHRVLAEDALRAWERKKTYRQRSAKGNAKRWDRDNPRDEPSGGEEGHQGSKTVGVVSPSDVRQGVQEGSREGLLQGSRGVIQQGLPEPPQGQGQGQEQPSVPIGTGVVAPKTTLFEVPRETPPAKPVVPSEDPDPTVIPLYLVAVADGTHAKALFGHGLAFVRRLTRKGDNEARRLLGKWRAELRNDDRRLWDMLVAADRVEGGVADLPSWIGARLPSATGRPAGQPAEPDDGLSPAVRAIIAETQAAKGAA